MDGGKTLFLTFIAEGQANKTRVVFYVFFDFQ